MADDLVVPNYGHARQIAEAWIKPYAKVHPSSANLASAYLERDAQLAGEKARLKCEPHLCQYGNHRDYYQIKDALAAMTAERDDLQRRNDTLAEIIGGEETSEVQNYEIVDVADLQAQLAAMTELREVALAAADERSRQKRDLRLKLAAMTAERDGARTERDTCRAASKATRELRTIAEDKLTASEAALQRIRERADFKLPLPLGEPWSAKALEALRDIYALAEPGKAGELRKDKTDADT